MADPVVYLDHHATTQPDPLVVDAMVAVLRSNYGNPASRHDFGARAEQAVAEARSAVAALINASPDEVVFTSGATESNNHVISGSLARSTRRRVVTSSIEHPSILEPLLASGVQVDVVQPNSDGLVDHDRISDAVTSDTLLTSIMLANNEVGTINAIAEYGGPVHRHDALLHSDATQAVGHIPIDVKTLGVDFLSFSSHKMYGPKGVGALYVRRAARERLSPLLRGGGHERDLRSGTLNVPAIVGFGVAAVLAKKQMSSDQKRVSELRDRLLQLLTTSTSNVLLNGPVSGRLPGNLNVCFPGVDAEALVLRLRNVVAMSTGAACSSTKVGPSHVLMSLYGDRERALSSVRFGVGRYNTNDEVERVAERVSSVVSQLRRLSSRTGHPR